MKTSILEPAKQFMTSTAEEPTTLSVRLDMIRYAAADISVFEFTDVQGLDLPAFTAGAHIDVYLPDGSTRQYSLCGDPDDRKVYQIAVLKLAAGTGGSLAMHEASRCGSIMKISSPRNFFPLIEDAPRHILIAGGIGITPMVAMQHTLEKHACPYVLHYFGRSSDRMAFREALVERAGAGQINLHVDRPDGTPGLNLSDLLATLREKDHVYICGPAGMLRAFTSSLAHWPSTQVHTEAFSHGFLGSGEGEGMGSFEAILAVSGKSIEVDSTTSLLTALQGEGFDITQPCTARDCGKCTVGYLDGKIIHSDDALTDEQRKTLICACCSRPTDGYIVLDI